MENDRPMIRIASADHGSGRPSGWEVGAATLTSTRRPPPDSGNAATVCAPSPSEPGAGKVDRLLERRQIAGAAGGPDRGRDQQPLPVGDRHGAARALRHPGHQADVEDAGRHKHRPFRTPGQRHRARRHRQDLIRRQQQAGRGVCPWRASRTIERASKRARQPRCHERPVLVLVEAEAVDAAPERLPPRLRQQQIAQRLLIDVGVERGDQPRVHGRVLRLTLQVSQQATHAVGGAQRRGLRLGRHAFAGPGVVEPHEQRHGPDGQRQHGARGEQGSAPPPIHDHPP